MADTNEGLTPERMAEIADALANRPAVERIVAFLEAGTLAGFVLQNVIAAWLIRRFPAARAFAGFRNAPAERAAIVACNPAFAAAMAAGADAPAVLPVDWFDVGAAAPVTCADPMWQEHDLAKPDLVLLPGQLSADPSRLEGLAERPPALRLPETMRAAAAEGLAAAGLQKDRWFAAVDAGPDDAHGGAISAHVRDVLGGDVYRLAAGDDFEATLGAVAHARFAIAADPLALTLASAFLTPCAGVGLADFGRHVWNAGDIVLAPGAEGVLRAAETLFTATKGCDGWRAPAMVTTANESAEPAEIVFPLKLRDAPLVDVWD